MTRVGGGWSPAMTFRRCPTYPPARAARAASFGPILLLVLLLLAPLALSVPLVAWLVASSSQSPNILLSLIDLNLCFFFFSSSRWRLLEPPTPQASTLTAHANSSAVWVRGRWWTVSWRHRVARQRAAGYMKSGR